MSELRLKFIDAEGNDVSFETKEPLVTIGRHSSNSLVVADGRLSREHLLIERDGANWFAEDLGSSNGTTVNGERLADQRRLKNGDKLSLGGFEIAVEIEQAAESAVQAAQAMPPPQAPAIPAATPAYSPPSNDGFPKSFLLIAPLLGLVVILIAGGFLYFANKKGGDTDRNDISYSTPETSDTPSTNPTPASTQNDTNEPTGTPSGTPVKEDTATQKIEKYTAQFMRKAANNDPRYFLTSTQAGEVGKRVQSMSSAVKANLPAITKNSAELNKLAAANGLNADLLAAAALAKLGTSRGDALAAARSMAGVLSKLTIQIGNELGDDCLLMIAAYDQGVAGDFLKMRNMLQDVATKSNAPAREIRSIWFLNKSGKITSQEYELALRFLAAGAIMQAPSEF
ncbi:MAG: FHA domain-containing protein [Acidobacteria bacterium]|nr:FHA domain-containing protein [Acidobacteriota bacterium]